MFDKKNIYDLLCCFSLANILLINTWVFLLHKKNNFFYKNIPSLNDYAAGLINLLFLTAIFYLINIFLCKIKVKNLKYVNLACLFLEVCLLLRIVQMWIGISGLDSIIKFNSLLALTFCLIFLLFALMWPRKYRETRRTTLLIFSPFLAFTLSGTVGGFAVTKEKITFIGPPSNNLQTSIQNAPHMVWIIFDEMDMRLAFIERPKNLNLTEFDLIRSSSFFAENAFPPASNTLRSIPSLLTGMTAIDAVPIGSSDMELSLEKFPYRTNWSSVPNLFSWARDKGINTALVGSYLPYDRLLGSNLKSPPIQTILTFNGHSSNGTLFSSILRQVEFIIPGYLRLQRHQMVFDLIEASKEYACNSFYGVVFCHLMIPHFPVIYSKDQGLIKYFEKDTAIGYFENLSFADNVLGEIRHALESAQIWEKSVIILTSDHGWRDVQLYDGKRDNRVPCIIKLPYSTRAVSYNPVFKTVQLFRLIQGGVNLFL